MCKCVFTSSHSRLQGRKNEREAMSCKGEKREREGGEGGRTPPRLRAPAARHLPHYSLLFAARRPLCAAFLFVHSISEIAAQRAAPRGKAFCFEARPQSDRQRYAQSKPVRSAAPGGRTGSLGEGDSSGAQSRSQTSFLTQQLAPVCQHPGCKLFGSERQFEQVLARKRRRIVS